MFYLKLIVLSAIALFGFIVTGVSVLNMEDATLSAKWITVAIGVWFTSLTVLMAVDLLW